MITSIFIAQSPALPASWARTAFAGARSIDTRSLAETTTVSPLTLIDIFATRFAVAFITQGTFATLVPTRCIGAFSERITASVVHLTLVEISATFFTSVFPSRVASATFMGSYQVDALALSMATAILFDLALIDILASFAMVLVAFGTLSALERSNCVGAFPLGVAATIGRGAFVQICAFDIGWSDPACGAWSAGARPSCVDAFHLFVAPTVFLLTFIDIRAGTLAFDSLVSGWTNITLVVARIVLALDELVTTTVGLQTFVNILTSFFTITGVARGTGRASVSSKLVGALGQSIAGRLSETLINIDTLVGGLGLARGT